MENTFKSARLIYRAFDWDTDQEYIRQRQSDVSGVANSSGYLLKPSTKDDFDRLKRGIESCLLAVVICLPPASEGEKAVPVGDISLSGVERRNAHHRNTTIGIRILPAHQSRGYGSEAIMWATDWAFRVTGLHRVGISGASWNKRATDLYERLGFVPEGRKRECVWYNGGWHDSVDLAMLDREWEARKQKA